MHQNIELADGKVPQSRICVIGNSATERQAVGLDAGTLRSCKIHDKWSLNDPGKIFLVIHHQLIYVIK